VFSHQTHHPTPRLHAEGPFAPYVRPGLGLGPGRLGLRLARLGWMAAGMERDGLISTGPDPDDARRVRYYLTSTARALEPDLAANLTER